MTTVWKICMIRPLICLLAAALPGLAETQAPALSCQNGNILYTAPDGREKQLTRSGRDGRPALHPGGEWVYFIKSFEGHFEEERYIPPAGKHVPAGTMMQEELWRVRTTGSDAQMLYRHDVPGPGPNEEHEVAYLDNIQFSPDGQRVYFEASRWATSKELWIMDKDGKNRRALGAGNETRVIQTSSLGDFCGFLITRQHRYFVIGGSYDWYYLFTPDMGKEIGPIGEDLPPADILQVR